LEGNVFTLAYNLHVLNAVPAITLNVLNAAATIISAHQLHNAFFATMLPNAYLASKQILQFVLPVSMGFI